MIPKKIHYCWFGKSEMPQKYRDYMKSWRKYCPDYEVKEWNESNFDIYLFPYVWQAYNLGKYAFVSDVARLYALYTEGGIYLDTDVEILKSFDSLLDNVAFSGFEDTTHVTTGIMASEKGGVMVHDNLYAYADRQFLFPDGTTDTTTNVAVMTQYLIDKGMSLDNETQTIDGIATIYPRDFFCPKGSYAYDKPHITPRSYAIHYFDGSWQIRNTPEYIRLRKKYWFIPYFIRKKMILAHLGQSDSIFYSYIAKLLK